MCVFGRLRNVEEVAQPVYDATPLEQGAVGMNRPFFYCLIAGKDFVTMNIQSLFSRLCPRWLLRRKDSKNDILPDRPPENDLERRMAEFLENDRFVLYLQPVIDLTTGRIRGAEALARLDHPERGLLFPDVFLPVINRLGLQMDFDLYMFRKSCAWLGRSRGLAGISVNFSRKTLCRPGLVRELATIADRCGVACSDIAIEVTECEKEPDETNFIRNLQGLKSCGFLVFLDDYGDGVTVITDLQRCPMDIVKLDRSLLLGAESSEEGAIIFRSLVEMATKIGIDTVCEGIETDAQEQLAKESGCRYAQGFRYFRPTEANELLKRIAPENA